MIFVLFSLSLTAWEYIILWGDKEREGEKEQSPKNILSFYVYLFSFSLFLSLSMFDQKQKFLPILKQKKKALKSKKRKLCNRMT